MAELIASFLSLVLIVCAIDLLIRLIGRIRGEKLPTTRKLFAGMAISSAIAIVITLTITFAMMLTGVLDAMFYRPSGRDFARDLGVEAAPEEVAFASEDGTALHGWFLAAKNAKGTVVHLHGSDRNITYTAANAAWLTQRGYNVFAFDYRGYGQSGGSPSRRGVVDDSLAAIEYIASREGAGPIALWGQSMGGQLAIVAAARADSPEVRAVIAEATYSNHSLHVQDKMASIGPLWVLQWAGWLLTSDSLSAAPVIGELDAPVLLVHGTADTAVDPAHSERLYERASEPKELWIIEDERHLTIFGQEFHRDRLGQYLDSLMTPAE